MGPLPFFAWGKSGAGACHGDLRVGSWIPDLDGMAGSRPKELVISGKVKARELGSRASSALN